VVVTAFVTVVGTVGLLIATVVGTDPPPILFTAAFLLASAVMWYAALTVFAIEIIVWPTDGRVVFRCVAKERVTSLAEIESISRGPLVSLRQRGNAVTVRYRGGTAYVLKYLDWNDFISRVRERNPQVNVQNV
jgi:hypothetical protein